MPVGPVRKILAIALVSCIGTGLWLGSFVLFLTRSVDLAPQQVGFGALIAGVVGIVAATPAGMLADRFGYRRVLFVLYLCGGLATVLYVVVHHFWPYVLAACLLALATESSMGVRTALTTVVTDDERQMSVLAQSRVMAQIGLAIGAAGAAVVIQLDTRAAYVTMLTATALSFLICAALVTRLPASPLPTPERRRPGSVLADRPYLLVTALIAVLTLNWGMLSTGIPLWVVHHTEAPRWASAAIVVLNALAIAVLQVRFSRPAESTRGSMRAARHAGLLLALACLTLASTAGGRGVGVITLLLLAACIHVLGELLYVAASWGLSITLMPAEARGEYQGMNAAGLALAQAFAPLVMTTLIVDRGRTGWLVLAIVFATAGMALTPAANWALRTRPTSPAATG
ncbi:MFS transporter [Actinoplanes sp. NPDC051475]|uniref:MFS transporter n=1 Tax=Actinoplanes sp. NPDC051475 TaxID=3157225 RepID=UPI00344EF3C9